MDTCKEMEREMEMEEEANVFRKGDFLHLNTFYLRDVHITEGERWACNDVIYAGLVSGILASGIPVMDARVLSGGRTRGRQGYHVLIESEFVVITLAPLPVALVEQLTNVDTNPNIDPVYETCEWVMGRGWVGTPIEDGGARKASIGFFQQRYALETLSIHFKQRDCVVGKSVCGCDRYGTEGHPLIGCFKGMYMNAEQTPYTVSLQWEEKTAGAKATGRTLTRHEIHSASIVYTFEDGSGGKKLCELWDLGLGW